MEEVLFIPSITLSVMSLPPQNHENDDERRTHRPMSHQLLEGDMDHFTLLIFPTAFSNASSHFQFFEHR